MYRLKKELDRITTTGSFRNITLRDGDEFGDLVEAMNQALAVVERGGTAESTDTGQIVDELWKHLASFKQQGMCEPDAQRVEAWLEGIGRLLNDAGHGARSTA